MSDQSSADKPVYIAEDSARHLAIYLWFMTLSHSEMSKMDRTITHIEKRLSEGITSFEEMGGLLDALVIEYGAALIREAVARHD